MFGQAVIFPPPGSREATWSLSLESEPALRRNQQWELITRSDRAMMPDREVLQLLVNWKACGCVHYTAEDLKPFEVKG